MIFSDDVEELRRAHDQQVIDAMLHASLEYRRRQVETDAAEGGYAVHHVFHVTSLPPSTAAARISEEGQWVEVLIMCERAEHGTARW